MKKIFMSLLLASVALAGGSCAKDDMDNGTGPSPLLAEKVREGNLGAKTGQGFFSWQGEDGKRIIESRNKALLRALKNAAADAAAAQA